MLTFSILHLGLLMCASVAQFTAAEETDYVIKEVNGTKLWPNGVVPFMIYRNVGMELKVMIWTAMLEIEQRTCIKFVFKGNTNRKDFVSFINSGECGSSLGLVEYGEQFLFLGEGCHRLGIVFHEIFHVLGFSHEHARPDRDDYLIINRENIREGFEHIFDKRLPNETIILNDFDYHSIMMYSEAEYSKGSRIRGLMTITAKNETVKLYGSLVNERPSESDYWRLNKLYDCKDKLKE